MKKMFQRFALLIYSVIKYVEKKKRDINNMFYELVSLFVIIYNTKIEQHQLIRTNNINVKQMMYLYNMCIKVYWDFVLLIIEFYIGFSLFRC
jgi:hypothetical protein